MPVGEAEEDQADQVKKPKVDRLREQRDKLNSQIRQIEVHETNRKRRDDTRRKVLIGAAIMARVNNQKDDWSEDKLLAMMDNFLTRPKERDLFGLEPLPKPQGEAASTPVAKSPVNATSKRETKKAQDDKGKQALAASAATGISSEAGLGVQDTDQALGGGQDIHSQARQTAEDAIAVTALAESQAATSDQAGIAVSAGTEPDPPATTNTATPAPTSTTPSATIGTAPTTGRRLPKRRLPESADEDDLEKEFNL